MYDYSPIRKSYIPDEILEDISSSFFIREEIEDYTKVEIWGEGLVIFYIPETSLGIFPKWRKAFLVHGYDPPILNFK